MIIRVSGDPHEVTTATDLLRQAFANVGVLAEYPNRRELGVRAYVTAALPTAAVVEHPRWCDQARCDGRGHRSKVLHVRAGEAGDDGLNVFIHQPGDGTHPSLVLEVDPDDNSGEALILMSLPQAAGLLRAVGRLLTRTGVIRR